MLPSVDLIKSDKLSYLLLNSRDRITQYIKEHGHWGELESVICKIVTNKATNPIVIDAGSNLGGFALPVANHIQDLNGSIHCFEPQRIIFQQLCANVFINRLDNVYTYNVALGEKNIQIEIPELDFSVSEFVGSLSLNKAIREKQNKKNKISNRKPHMVQQITLDSLALMEDVAFVKVDIEGMELDFFKGAVNTLKSNNYPPIFSEIWEFKWYRESAIEIEKFLQSMGYKLTRFGKDIVAQHPAHKCQIQFHEEKKGLNITVTDNI